MKYAHLKKSLLVVIGTIVLGSVLSGCIFSGPIQSEDGSYPGSNSKSENHH